ncbi:MAG: 16S rRNA (adenine(1518)-N(6)/adenine(1519)-N(6))-dimethyltransferase RsmA [Clostridia bacterium]|nr:16S rRNA (adenine(1518)-N(6)/adenine(1519)-N(6))-dimethyltransferase RsmA [Clostridia bacterium]
MKTLEITKKILKQYNIRADKRYGQNFLIDDNILENIVDVSNITDDDLIIEIGPGLGNLTSYLLNRAGHALLIEIDNKMIEILNNRFDGVNNYTLLNQDILKVNIDELINNVEEKLNKKFKTVKVVANLPYYITTPILFKLLQESARVSEIIIMVQKEVAERMVARPKTKDYGILTLMVEYLAVASIEFIVPNNSFIPAPDVTSAIIKLIKSKRYNVTNEETLFKLIHASFAQRRKKMINSLESTSFLDMSKHDLETIFQKCDLSLNSRAEELTINDYIKIIETIKL